METELELVITKADLLSALENNLSWYPKYGAPDDFEVLWRDLRNNVISRSLYNNREEEQALAREGAAASAPIID